MAPARSRLAGVAIAVTVWGIGYPASAETVTLKNGLVYRGEVDKDNTIVTIFDGLKRIILKDTKVDKIASESEQRYETFPLVQPMTVHAGAMPASVVSVKAGSWDEFGRRSFEYVGPKLGKATRMTQAIIALGPKSVRFRGVDGFWQGQVATSQVAKASVLAVLAKIDQKLQGERLKACQFLIQAEWYPEALADLDRLVKDFPEPGLRQRVDAAKAMIRELQARQAFAEIDRARKAQQTTSLLARLKGFPTEGAPADVLVAVREQLRQEETQARADKALADAVRTAAEALPAEVRGALKVQLAEILAGLTAAPDAVRGRFEAFRKADTDGNSGEPEARFARVVSGWIVGAEAAVDDLDSATTLWTARESLHAYLASKASDERGVALGQLRELTVLNPTIKAREKLGLETLTRIARLTPPPLQGVDEAVPGKPKLLRVRDDDNPEPTEYSVLLPPEYHPLRSYPALIVLHGAETLDEALAPWTAEAARRGYLVIAPEYILRGQARDYHYTPSEHAAVELALRDARKRFSIDSDRVFLAGQKIGGNMAWDYGLAHPDLFAGVAVVSGLPAKYVWAYKDNAKRVPLFVVMGDLAPAEPELIFPLGKELIAKNYDVTYVEYYKRGIEDFPEEIPSIFDWMDRRVPREAFPKTFKVVTARSSDDRFFGVVVSDFAPGRAVSPSAVHPLGKDLKPASIDFADRQGANLLDLTVTGLQEFDMWVGPRMVDFSKRFEVRVNRRTAFRALAKLDIESYLEDLRLRGDKQQDYWMRVPVRLGGGRAAMAQ
jgi:pimeloyl-ACP methyl ester carboxylesterase